LLYCFIAFVSPPTGTVTEIVPPPRLFPLKESPIYLSLRLINDHQKTHKDKMRTIAYLRVSTEEQSLGLDAQRAACEAYCQKQGLEMNEVFSDEGLSGGLSFEKRPGILNAIASTNKGDVLVVAKRDRLSRGDVLAMAMIEAAIARKGARIVSAAGEGTESEDPSSILMRRMVDAFG
jgi:DNA invertase Pin-like site-specific DNA recombinase